MLGQGLTQELDPIAEEDPREAMRASMEASFKSPPIRDRHRPRPTVRIEDDVNVDDKASDLDL